MGNSPRSQFLQSMRRGVAPAARWFADLLLPPMCAACQGQVAATHGLCAACWAGLEFLSPPWCQCCGAPFPFDPGGAMQCAACLADPPQVVMSRAALAYGEGARRLILPLKHADRLDLAPMLARLMFAAAGEALQGGEILVPVPSHWTRLIRRRANQAAELARALSWLSGITYAPEALIRVRATPLQGSLGGVRGRHVNVKGAFTVPPHGESLVRGRVVVLVDDVWTTGATLNACARSLLGAGAKKVAAVTLARVVREGVSPL